MSRHDLDHAAELLDRLITHATPGPWRDSAVDGNRWHALVADQPHPDRTNPLHGGWSYDENYGGCLVGESHMYGDRRLMAVMRNVADDLPALLRAVADEDPIEVGRLSRTIAAALIDTHRPTSPHDDTQTQIGVTPQ